MAQILRFTGDRNLGNPPEVNNAELSVISHYREAYGMSTRSKASIIRDRYLRMQAVQVLAMLPDDKEEAQKVLSYAQTMLTEFIELGPPALNIVKRD